jgi:hypothetical protein
MTKFPKTNKTQGGLLIAFMGLPGSGKSATAKELSVLIEGALLFPEPEADQWPPAVRDRHEFGYFGAISWFRSMRVPLLYMATKVRCSGGIAIVDSYYDKLIADYIDHPEMRWLIPPGDDYFHVLKQMSLVDRAVLPDADCLIFLRVTQSTWRQLLLTRQRAMDVEDLFLESFSSQETFLLASQSFSRRTAVPLIVFDQKLNGPLSTAKALVAILMDKGIL